MNKIVASPEQAVADIPDGATVAIAGFGVAHRFATGLICALRDQKTKDLTLVCNSLGDAGATRGQILAENKQVKKLIAAFSVRPGTPTASEEQIAAGTMEVELVPQGILVERCRAGGAGIPAFYSPTGVDTDLATGREIREFDGKRHVLEYAIHVDYALLRGYRADRLGNVQFRGGSQNFNPSFAKAARVAIVEVDEIVEPGEIAPELIDLPGIFVARVVKTTQVVDGKAWRRPAATAFGSAAPLRRQAGADARGHREERRQARQGRHLRESRRRHPHDGVELSRGPRRDPPRRERRPRLRPDGDGGARNRSGHLQRRRPVRGVESRRVVLRQRHVLRDGARRPDRYGDPRRLRSRSDTAASPTGARRTRSAAASAARWTCCPAKAT